MADVLVQNLLVTSAWVIGQLQKTDELSVCFKGHQPKLKRMDITSDGVGDADASLESDFTKCVILIMQDADKDHVVAEPRLTGHKEQAFLTWLPSPWVSCVIVEPSALCTSHAVQIVCVKVNS